MTPADAELDRVLVIGDAPSAAGGALGVPGLDVDAMTREADVASLDVEVGVGSGTFDVEEASSVVCMLLVEVNGTVGVVVSSGTCSTRQRLSAALLELDLQ
jgi:hypothetical protein